MSVKATTNICRGAYNVVIVVLPESTNQCGLLSEGIRETEISLASSPNDFDHVCQLGILYTTFH